jgi:penicillin-binding protein A
LSAPGFVADERRHRIVTRALPIGAAAAVAFVIGVVAGASGGGSEAARAFADAWERQDFAAMHAQLSPSARDEYPLEEFTQEYVDAQATATALRVVTDEPDSVEAESGDAEAFEATVDTRAFGQVRGRVELPLDDEGLVAWEPQMAFPGLTPGEKLDRRTRLGERAPLLARDGTPLAEGPASARTSPMGASALAIAGSMGSPSRKQERDLYALGFPPGGLAGTSGLELAFNDRLAGQPSGQLLAVPAEGDTGKGRILASGHPLRGKAVKTTIDPEVQQAAVTALGSLYGGVAVLDARNGDVLGVAGLAFSAPQPPGSTFKVITATAALDEGVVKPTDEFPVETSNSLIGREIANSDDAPCGGSFVRSFADSCNTVFAPLGVDVGAEELLDKAELFGFNSPPALAADNALEALAPPASTIPDPIESDVALGETAIGQGQVLATPLQMASVAQTIAAEGMRSPTSIVRTPELRPDFEPVKVTSPETARTVRTMMIEVVRSGTGVAAQLPNAQVAGKTGTAELGPAALVPGDELEPGEEPEQEKDAWFLAFAPAEDPKLAVAVMIVNASGDGGVVAAPIAQQILASTLG